MSENTETTVEDTAPAMPEIVAGFAVLIGPEGNVFIERNPKVFSIPVTRESTLIEVRRYSSEILMDLNAQAAAEYAFLKLNPPVKEEDK